jgi:hypothetical protein
MALQFIITGAFLLLTLPLLWPMLPAGKEILICCCAILFGVMRILIKDDTQFMKVWGGVTLLSFIIF